MENCSVVNVNKKAMFRRPKKEEVIEVIYKCDFCKKRNSIGKAGGFHYCSDNVCITKWGNRRGALETIEDEKRKKRQAREGKKN